MNSISVVGNQKFMEKEIPVVFGGFGKDKKCISDKTIAEIHGMEARNVRARITDNIKRFKVNIDFIDLKHGACRTSTSEMMNGLGYTKSAITQAEHIYILSERGYAKLIKIMDTDLAWEIHDKLIDEYFELREEKQGKRIEKQGERLASVNNAVKILAPLLKEAGCNSQIQLLTVKSLYEKAGVVIPIEIKADKQYFDTVHIARQIGLYYKSSGKPADKAVNEIIRRLELPDDLYTDTWESKGSWEGTVRKYAPVVIDMVKQWYAANDYPRDIQYEECSGKTKAYHVVWRDMEVA